MEKEKTIKDFISKLDTPEGLDQYSYEIGVEKGAKWQEERMYSDMQEYAEFCVQCFIKNLPCIIAKDWFEQFKKK